MKGAYVAHIDSFAFAECHNLTTVRFPRVNYIGNYTFMNCFALKFFFSQVVPTIEWHTFKGCTNERFLSIPKPLFPDALNWEDAGFDLMENSLPPLTNPKYSNVEEDTISFDI